MMRLNLLRTMKSYDVREEIHRCLSRQHQIYAQQGNILSYPLQANYYSQLGLSVS